LITDNAGYWCFHLANSNFVKSGDHVGGHKGKKLDKHYALFTIEHLKNLFTDAANLAEKIITEKVLPSLGFTNVFKPTRNFYFDALAKTNGKIYAIEVTTKRAKTTKKYGIRFCEFFGLPLLFFFVKPDFSRYYLIKLKPEELRSSFHYKQGKENELKKGGLLA